MTEAALLDKPPLAESHPLAVVRGEAVLEVPQDLYIPPDALEIFLDAFEGPLDLLLYLIKRHNLDILDIPIAEITRQYIQYIDVMKELRLALAAEYLLMAAMLAEIKSRMLLPRPVEEDADEEDPRAELIRRLQEYERVKDAAQQLDELPREERDIFPTYVEPPVFEKTKPLPDVVLKELMLAMRDVLKRAALEVHHHIEQEPLSVRERMSTILSRIGSGRLTHFSTLFDYREGRMGVVVTFIAILELLKQSSIEIVQNEPFSPIHIKVVA